MQQKTVIKRRSAILQEIENTSQRAANSKHHYPKKKKRCLKMNTIQDISYSAPIYGTGQLGKSFILSINWLVETLVQLFSPGTRKPGRKAQRQYCQKSKQRRTNCFTLFYRLLTSCVEALLVCVFTLSVWVYVNLSVNCTI